MLSKWRQTSVSSGRTLLSFIRRLYGEVEEKSRDKEKAISIPQRFTLGLKVSGGKSVGFLALSADMLSDCNEEVAQCAGPGWLFARGVIEVCYCYSLTRVSHPLGVTGVVFLLFVSLNCSSFWRHTHD